MKNNWNKKISMDDFYEIIVCSGYPNWDKLNDEVPYYVLRESIHKVDKSSHNLSVEFDDIAKGQFYSRDWTKSRVPFIDEGEVYWSGFWFQYKEDAEKFFELYPDKCKGNWMPDYETFLTECNNKRNTKCKDYFITI